MYRPDDTIVAVSTPASEKRVIVRISGPDTVKGVRQIFEPPVGSGPSSVTSGQIVVAGNLKLDATLYLFKSPHSYTGEDLAEIHVFSNRAVTNSVLTSLLNRGLRAAEPGEFTARAYFNNKIDLAQAEAVNEIITASNRFQLNAAENLLTGRLAETTKRICDAIMDCLTTLEAGLDFSSEDIEFTSGAETVGKLTAITSDLHNLLASSIRCESLIELPAVGIAGAPNAGKSTLGNALLGRERSIVSPQRKTTRDVLTAELTLSHCRCVLFDCAGLILQAETILDELAQQAAVQALHNASVVLFCVDIARPDWSEDLSVLELIEAKDVIPVATKTDLLLDKGLNERLIRLNKSFGADFLVVSAHTGLGLDRLKSAIDNTIIAATMPAADKQRDTRYAIRNTRYEIALTARHTQAVTEATDDITQAVNELKAGNDEIAAMHLRTAYQGLIGLQQHTIDEKILERIFSRFCVGK